MKDFLQGRPQSRSIRLTHASDPQPSQFPPIPSLAHADAPPLEQEPLPVENPIPDAPNPTPCAAQEPLVEMVPDAQGRIGHIVVTCRCGEQTIVQCNY